MTNLEWRDSAPNEWWHKLLISQGVGKEPATARGLGANALERPDRLLEVLPLERGRHLHADARRSLGRSRAVRRQR
jgi:hypothetical protein